MALVSWPAEQERRRSLAAAGLPRLLLVEAGAALPEVVDCSEDWVQAPCSEAELAARIETLRARAARPTLDDDGVLRFGDRWVALPPVEAKLLRPLLERFGAVVSRQVVLQAGWADGPTRRNALDVHMLRLRRRVAAVGLQVRTVRSRGYLLEAAPEP